MNQHHRTSNSQYLMGTESRSSAFKSAPIPERCSSKREHTPPACGLRRRAANFDSQTSITKWSGGNGLTKPMARRHRQHAGRVRSLNPTASLRHRSFNPVNYETNPNENLKNHSGKTCCEYSTSKNEPKTNPISAVFHHSFRMRLTTARQWIKFTVKLPEGRAPRANPVTS
jgi:hypothetical protein